MKSTVLLAATNGMLARQKTSLLLWKLPLGSEWGWLTVYILAPIVGAILGGGFYKKVVEPIFMKLPEEA